jgi:hypothetical protein
MIYEESNKDDFVFYIKYRIFYVLDKYYIIVL